tara:strand:- start:37 stop:951 length:915 start_codon:yes stop_codon:yes gene_type:complete
MIKSKSEMLDELMHLHKHGRPEGSRLGLKSFDDNLTFVKGGCTDVTGYPFYGKSVFLKEVLVGLTVNSGWKHCLYMPDDGSDVEIISNFIHKLTGKEVDNPKNKITEKEIAKVYGNVCEHFMMVSSAINIEPEAFWELAKENKCDSAVIDSWNYMAHKGEPTSPDYLRKILSLRNRFMQVNNMHSFIVIHPKNPDPKSVKDGSVNKPSVYDLMGGSEWNNNGKNIVVVHKNSKENHEPYQIHVDKVKPKHYGNIGTCTLSMDWRSQRFYEYNAPLNKKTFAYAPAEVVKDPINDIFTVSDNEPF